MTLVLKRGKAAEALTTQETDETSGNGVVGEIPDETKDDGCAEGNTVEASSDEETTEGNTSDSDDEGTTITLSKRPPLPAMSEAAQSSPLKALFPCWYFLYSLLTFLTTSALFVVWSGGDASYFVVQPTKNLLAELPDGHYPSCTRWCHGDDSSCRYSEPRVCPTKDAPASCPFDHNFDTHLRQTDGGKIYSSTDSDTTFGIVDKKGNTIDYKLIYTLPNSRWTDVCNYGRWRQRQMFQGATIVFSDYERECVRTQYLYRDLDSADPTIAYAYDRESSSASSTEYTRRNAKKWGVFIESGPSIGQSQVQSKLKADHYYLATKARSTFRKLKEWYVNGGFKGDYIPDGRGGYTFVPNNHTLPSGDTCTVPRESMHETRSIVFGLFIYWTLLHACNLVLMFFQIVDVTRC